MPAVMTQVDPATVSGTAIDTTNLTGGTSPGSIYDHILYYATDTFWYGDGTAPLLALPDPSSGITPLLTIGEKLAGQTLSADAPFDVIAGSPTSPPTISVGAASQNFLVLTVGANKAMMGVSAASGGYPAFAAIGEGCLAFVAATNFKALKFSLTGVHGGSVTINFYRSDASSAGSFVIVLPSVTALAFRTDTDEASITAFTLENTDAGGLAYYLFEFEFGVAEPPAPPPPPLPPPEDPAPSVLYEWRVKTAAEHIGLEAEFISLLADGDYVVSCTVTAAIFYGVDASASTILVDAVEIRETLVTQQIAGGIEGNVYRVYFVATSAFGKTVSLHTILAITSPTLTQ